jgi:cell division protein FtsB
MARKGGRGGQRVSPAAKLAMFAAIVAAIVFAIVGGEYSTFDLIRQRSERKRLLASLDSLRRAVDSLKQYRRRLETDPALQERLAREEFGMVRGDRELLYRLAAPADSAKTKAR